MTNKTKISMENIKHNQTVILNRNGKKYVAVVQDFFEDGQYGLMLAFNPDNFITKSKNGVLYSATIAAKHELTENITGLSLKVTE